MKAMQPVNSDVNLRKKVLLSLDGFVKRNPFERSAATVAHYRKMIDMALEQVEKSGYIAGVKVWKLYSDGYLCKSGNTVFGFDLNQGAWAQRWMPDV